jgi:hypothetical protein
MKKGTATEGKKILGVLKSPKPWVKITRVLLRLGWTLHALQPGKLLFEHTPRQIMTAG